jgi:hypothetical protein
MPTFKKVGIRFLLKAARKNIKSKDKKLTHHVFAMVIYFLWIKKTLEGDS